MRAAMPDPSPAAAVIEADERGLADVLASEFEPASQYLVDALIYCDITTSPDGKQVTADQRLAEIQDRYGEGHLVSRSIRRAAPQLLSAARTIEDMARASGGRHTAFACERFLVGGHHDLPAGAMKMDRSLSLSVSEFLYRPP